MHNTKTEILALLKRSDGATVDDIATSLSLASMTVRQHLTALQRDALIQAQEVRRATGRPHYLYSLSDDGHRAIAQGHDRLVALIVEAAGYMDPADSKGASAEWRRSQLFRQAATLLAARTRGELMAAPVHDRPARLVEILRAHGGFADWHAGDETGELRDFNCVYRAAVATDGPCEWHEPLIEELIGPVVRVAPSADCVACCRYEIQIPAGRPATSMRGAPSGAARTAV